MESFSLMAWRHFLHRATDEWTYRLETEGETETGVRPRGREKESDAREIYDRKAGAKTAPSSGSRPPHHPFWAPSHMVGRALLILRTSPSDGSLSSGKETSPSWSELLDQTRHGSF